MITIVNSKPAQEEVVRIAKIVNDLWEESGLNSKEYWPNYDKLRSIVTCKDCRHCRAPTAVGNVMFCSILGSNANTFMPCFGEFEPIYNRYENYNRFQLF